MSFGIGLGSVKRQLINNRGDLHFKRLKIVRVELCGHSAEEEMLLTKRQPRNRKQTQG